jgi:hypothetical protein
MLLDMPQRNDPNDKSPMADAKHHEERDGDEPRQQTTWKGVEDRSRTPVIAFYGKRRRTPTS